MSDIINYDIMGQLPYSNHEKALKVRPKSYDTIDDYIRKTSQIDGLYDYLTFSDKKLCFPNGTSVILGQEQDLYFPSTPIYRAFHIDKHGKKTLMATITDQSHGMFTFFDELGNRFAGRDISRTEVPMYWVKDGVMTAQVQDMTELAKVDPTTTSKITQFNSKGKFNSAHACVLDNFINLVKGILVGSGDVDTDIIRNADKHMTFYDITPEVLEKSGLLETGKFQVHQNALEINNGFIDGIVPLFEGQKIDIKEDGAPLSIKMRGKWYNPPINAYLSDGVKITKRIVEQKPSMLDEQAMTFIKAVAKYLTELNKTIGTNIKYIDLIKKLMIR